MSLKERLRGIVAAVATAALALSVAPVSALAAPAAQLAKGNATVIGVDGAASVELYKVASVTNGDDNVLVTTLEAGFDFDIKDYINNNAEVANKIAGQLPANAEATYTAPGTNGTLQGDTATFTDIDAGLYLVKVNPEQAGWSYQTMILSVVPQPDASTGTWGTPTGTVELKKNTDTVETSLTKQVSADNQTWASSEDTAAYDDTIYFKVSVDLPTYNGLSADSSVYFELVDDLPEELKVVSGSYEVAIGDQQDVSLNGGIYKTTQDGHDRIRVKLTAKDLMGVTEGDTLVLTYQAKLTSRSLAGEFKNTAYVNWFKHITDEKATSTDPVDASVIVYGTNVTKVVGELQGTTVVGSSDGQRLNGAVFQLEKKQADGTWKMLNTNVKANPTTMTVKSLGAGEYRWIELQAPAGYQLNEKAFEFTIGTDEANDDFVVENYFGDLADETGAANLPQTGGPGTIALTVVGVGLIAGAAVWAVRSRKEN